MTLFLKILLTPFLIVLLLIVVFFVLTGKLLKILSKACIEIGDVLGAFELDVLEAF